MEIDKEELKELIRKVVFSPRKSKAQWIYKRIYEDICWQIDNHGN